MRFEQTDIAGVRFFAPNILQDTRGFFAKLTHQPTFSTEGLSALFPEHYVSNSRRGVVRGMHLQLPPHEHDKLVVCLSGRVMDVVLDLRRAQPTFQKAIGRELDGTRLEGVYVPCGCAHGFQALTDDVLMAYYVSSVYSPEADGGVRFDSFGFNWPEGEAIASERDLSLEPLRSFLSPF